MLKYLLYPFAMLYGLVVKIRNYLFDKGFFRSTPIKGTICVGNLTVGGTGKTPFTEYLISLLKAETEIAVLSRGYKRKTKGFLLADSQSNATAIGDEPYQMFSKFPNVPLAVDEERLNGIRAIRQLNPKNQIIILDDAFQHRRVKAELNILLTDYHNPIYSDFFLPMGRLRDSFAERKRAQLIIVTKCPKDLSQQKKDEITKRLRLMPHQEVFFSSITYGTLKPVFATEILTNPQLTKQLQTVALAGIAKPGLFFNHLEQSSNLQHTISLSDHHQFSEKKIKAIFDKFSQMPNEPKAIVTTEKDAVRLKEFVNLPLEIKTCLYYLPMEVEFLQGSKSSINQIIQSYVRET